MLGEDLEERRLDSGVELVRREVRRSIAPDRGHLGRHDPVVSVAQGRVLVAREPAERRARGLHDDEILDAGLDRRPAEGSHHGRDPRPAAGADKGIGRRPVGRRDRQPAVLADRDARPVDLLEFEEVVGQGATVCFERPGEVLFGVRVRGVLHRVGRHDELVVAVDMRGREVTFEGDCDGEVAQPVGTRAADHPHQADLRLAVAVRAELDHRGPSADSFACRSIAMSTTASSARCRSSSRERSSAATKSGISAARGRPATNTQ